MKKKKIKIPIYVGDLVIIQTNDFRKVEKKYKLRDTSGMSAFMFKTLDKKGFSQYVVCFGKNVKNSIIVHECVHAVNELFDHVGIKLDIKNDEAQAYLTEWMFEQCNKFLNKK